MAGLTKKSLVAIEKTRKVLIKKAEGKSEVTWAICRREARVPKADSTTVARSMEAAGYDVKARRPREKALRTKKHEEEREQICKKWVRYPSNYFQEGIDMIIDNKRFNVPTFRKAFEFAKKPKVRFHLRTPGEGLKKGFTKPSLRKHKMNTGGQVQIRAGITGGDVIL